jgi:hypothetical protein
VRTSTLARCGRACAGLRVCAQQVLYQDEPLVQLLVSLKAHHYIEFKLVEGK